MTNLDSILKSRGITLQTEVGIVKAMVFPAITQAYETWTIKKAKCRTDAFKLWCWKRLLRVPWTARRQNQSILKEINPEYSLEGLLLKLKLQYSGHLIWRADSLEKPLKLGKIEGKRKRGWQWVRWVRQHQQLKGRESPGESGGQRSLARHAVHRSVTRLCRLRSLKVTKSGTPFSDWATNHCARINCKLRCKHPVWSLAPKAFTNQSGRTK